MKQIILLVMLFTGIGQMIAQSNIKRPESYNYLRGVEAIQNENTQEALEYLNKDIAEHRYKNRELTQIINRVNSGDKSS